MRIAGVLGADGVSATGEASFCSVVSEIQTRLQPNRKQCPPSIAETNVSRSEIDRHCTL